MELTEIYIFDIEDTTELFDGSFKPSDGTDAVLTYDDMDSDEAAANYEGRSFKITDYSTGEELPVDESEV